MLGHNNYGKAEIRVLRVDRDSATHEIVDLNVSVALAGDLTDTHLTGDNAHVLPTDTQKNTVYAFARDGVASPEAFGLRLARHFVDSQPTIHRSRVSLVEYPWQRLGPHSFARAGGGARTATVTYDGGAAWVVAGLDDLVLLNSTDSEFAGYIVDRYTTLTPASDRILATAVSAAWRYAIDDGDWNDLAARSRAALVGAFVGTYSYSLQQTLRAMGQAVLDAVPAVVEVRLSLPNRHHFLVDLSPFGLTNPGEVFNPDDRPYGLIEGTVLREDAPPPGLAWSLGVLMLSDSTYDEVDALLSPVDEALLSRYPGGGHTRQPVHTLYVPADLFGRGVLREYSRVVLNLVREHGPLPFPADVNDRVLAKLHREPVEDLRIDFEDGYGVRSDDEEDGHARTTATALAQGDRPSFLGLRIKSLEAPTRRRALRTLDVFLDALGTPPPGFVVTLPKVSDPAQVAAMVVLCGRLEAAHGLPDRALRFEVQIETPPAILGADGTATVARLITAAEGRCVGLHYGTYDYSASLGIAAEYQSLEHPVADHAKAVMQVAAAGTGVRLSDGSTNVIPVGSTSDVRAAWELHARLVRRSLERGFYQGWDLNVAQLPTRYGATYAFYRSAARGASERLGRYLSRRSSGILDEPATARAMAGFLLRGLDCGALDPDEVHFERSALEEL